MRLIEDGVVFDTEKADLILEHEWSTQHPNCHSKADRCQHFDRLYMTKKGRWFAVSQHTYAKDRDENGLTGVYHDEQITWETFNDIEGCPNDGTLSTIKEHVGLWASDNFSADKVLQVFADVLEEA